MEAIGRSACSDEFLVHELVDSKFRQFTAKTGVLYSSQTGDQEQSMLPD
jgi:hypothetical protein